MLFDGLSMLPSMLRPEWTLSCLPPPFPPLNFLLILCSTLLNGCTFIIRMQAYIMRRSYHFKKHYLLSDSIQSSVIQARHMITRLITVVLSRPP